MPDFDCPLSELPASQCACPRHRGGDAPGEESIETVGQPYTAHYCSPCAHGCEYGVLVGDTIARTADLGWVHFGRCP